MTSARTRAACFWLLGGALVVSGMFGGCRPTPEGPPEIADPEPLRAPWFKDVTDEVGLDFIHDAGPAGSFFMPQALGSGAALFDFDGDGLLDIYLLQNGGPKGKTNRLYRQLPGGRFQDVSKGSGLDFAGHNMGVAIGDVNNDGFPDVLVTQYGGIRLLLNNGDGRTRAGACRRPSWTTIGMAGSTWSWSTMWTTTQPRRVPHAVACRTTVPPAPSRAG